jgi:hypothetical protein
MSAVTSLTQILATPIPAWLTLLAIGVIAVAFYAVQQISIVKRLDSHARSLGHMDRWADVVESRLEELAQGLNPWSAASRGERRPIPVSANDRPERPVDFRDLSDDQVRSLLIRLVGTRAA